MLKIAYLANRITIAVHIDRQVFYLWLHILSFNCRKSCNKWFSLFKRLILRACSAIMSLSAKVLQGRTLGHSIISQFQFSLLFNVHVYVILWQYTCLAIPNARRFLYAFFVAFIARHTSSSVFAWVYFCLDINLPPML